jgi:hypothetical protein
MGGGISLDRLEQITGVLLDRQALPPDCRTLHDWVRVHLDRPVRGGDIIRSSGLRVLIRKVRRQQVLEAQVAKDESAPPQSLAGDALARSNPPIESAGHS